MNLRDLRYIVAVSETQHFGKAAQRCFVSQPTLSGQIKKLEEELGVTLFERTNRSVEITPVGVAVVAHARRMLEQASEMKELAQAHRDPLSGPLRLGVIPTLSPYLMPLILAPLLEQLAQLKLVLSEELTDTLLQRLRNHEIDAALLATPADDPDLEATPLFDEPFWFAHPRQHRLHGKTEINQADLDSVELLLLSEGHCLAEQAMAVCNLKERTEQGDMGDLRAASLETLLQLVGAGFGCTLVPALAVGGYWTTDTGIIARPMDVADAYRRVSLVFRPSFPRRPALEALARIIRNKLPDTVRVLPPATRQAVSTRSDS